MSLQRVPVPVLRPFIALLWAADDTGRPALRAVRERVLPTGSMHLVFRLSPDPLRVFEALDSPLGQTLGHALIGGARASCYIRDVSAPSRSVGAMLRPGAALPLFGVSAAAFSGQHTRLDDVWGRAADAARERLLELETPERQLDYFESLLVARLPRVRGLHPAIAEALGKLGADSSVRQLVAESGQSHRRFIALFEEAVGLTPKRYARVVRFRRALARLAAEPRVPLVELALRAGYADQAHFNRDFREMAGLSPTQYRTAAPEQAHHVPCLRPRGA